MLSVKREKLSEQQSFPFSYRQEENGNNEKRTIEREREKKTQERKRNILFDESLSSHCSIERYFIFFSFSSNGSNIDHNTKRKRISAMIELISMIDLSSRLFKGKQVFPPQCNTSNKKARGENVLFYLSYVLFSTELFYMKKKKKNMRRDTHI